MSGAINMSHAAARKAPSAAAAGAEPERLVHDRSQYIAFLEQQLERVSAACQNVQFMDEKLDHLKQTQNTYEAKISNLAKLVKLDKQHTSKIKADADENTDNLKKRIKFLEEQSRNSFGKMEEKMARLEQMYSAFPSDAAAINAHGGAQPQGLPGFIATYIHSLFTQHTQSTAASLTQQSQTHQIHLQNWVQEYIRTTHPSTKLTEEVAACKTDLQSLGSKVEQGEARLLSLLEGRLSGYTEIYKSMEEHFLGTIDVHNRTIRAQVDEYESRVAEVQRALEEVRERSDAATASTAALSAEVGSHRDSTHNFLAVLDEMKVKLDSGIVDFNANINSLVLELREKTWHAEQTCSRLAVDTISRQNVFSKKVEAQVQAQHDALASEVQTQLALCQKQQEELKQNVATFERKMEKMSKKSENRIQILANTLRDKFDEEAPVQPAAPATAAAAVASMGAPSAVSAGQHLAQLDALSQRLDAKLAALRRDVEQSEHALRQQVAQDTAATVAAACGELHLQLDKEMEDKIYMAERANQAHSLSRKSEQLAGAIAEGSAGSSGANAATAAGAAAGGLGSGSNVNGGSFARAEDMRSLKQDLSSEIKKNLAAMHALVEEKLRMLERKSASANSALSQEQSRSIGTALRDLEERSRAADQLLHQAQELYHTLQRQVNSGAWMAQQQQQQQQHAAVPAAAPSGAVAPAPTPAPASASSPPAAVPSAPSAPVRHRPASPTIYAPPNSMPAPPAPVAPVPPPSDGGDGVASDPFQAHYPHPPAFASALPYYHDPKDPHAPFLAHSSLPEGAYVPPAHDATGGVSRIHQYQPHSQYGAAVRDEVVRQAVVRKAADAALTRALSPLRHRSSSPPPQRSPSLLARFASSPHAGAGVGAGVGGSAIHHHTADDMFIHNRPASKPYALIPSHFPPAAAPSSFFDGRGGGGAGGGGGGGSGANGFGGAGRSLDDSDMVVHDRAIASSMGNIDQLLRSMEFMDSVEGRNTKSTKTKPAKPVKSVPMKRTGGGFIAPNLLLPTAASASKAKSPYVEDEDEEAFLRQSRRAAAARQNR